MNSLSRPGDSPARPGSKSVGPVKRAVLAITLAASVTLPSAAAVDAGFRRNVGDYSLYLSVMPADVIRGPLAPVDPAASPNRPPAARDTRHVMVSIFESRDGRRVTDARVAARVAALGFSGEKKPLERTAVAGAAVYGGFFPMMGRGPYRVDVEFQAPPTALRQHASFYFTQPSFEMPRRDARTEVTR